MTSLGHTLVGASVGLLCLPALDKGSARFLFLVGMIAVASLPDWPIPGWGHYRLDISHSVIVNGGAMLGMSLFMRGLAGSAYKRYRLAIAGVLAVWGGHLLMDTLYADSSMVLFWPLSDIAVSLPVPWLKTMPHVPPPFDDRILEIFLFEGLTFAPLLVLALTIRRRFDIASRKY